ncbi:hypothetical protein CBFG_01864 [Clostridiales bacterium 1_7_47FAA]|nr:hypothetical protein CBFG_01864 [Clostridiales bacterium 1_7_47FAA]
MVTISSPPHYEHLALRRAGPGGIIPGICLARTRLLILYQHLKIYYIYTENASIY